MIGTGATNALRVRQALVLHKHNSVAPQATRLTRSRMQAKCRSMRHVVAKAATDDAAVFGTVRERAPPMSDGAARSDAGRDRSRSRLPATGYGMHTSQTI
jgi:hypothetical protein